MIGMAEAVVARCCKFPGSIWTTLLYGWGFDQFSRYVLTNG